MSKITKEQCNELCTLMGSIQLKAATDNSGELSGFDALNGSFAYDGEISREDRETMAEQWATVVVLNSSSVFHLLLPMQAIS